MSLKYNRFLLTTCLPVVATLCLASVPAMAGFEWTPPEQQQAQPLPETDNGSVLPPLEESRTPSAPQMQQMQPRTTNAGAPVMKVKVLGDMPQAQPTAPAETQQVMQHQSAPVQPAEQPQPIPQQAAAPTEKGLSINPYPQPQQTETAQPVLLPEDPNQGLSGIDAKTATTAAPAPTASDNQAFPVIEGFGTDMPLVIALTQIVPPDYAYSFGAGVNAGTLVSWEGGKPWNDVLTNVLAPLNIDLKIHGKTVSLISRNAPAAAVPTPMAAPDQHSAVETPKTKAEDILAQDPSPEQAVSAETAIIRDEPVQKAPAEDAKIKPQEGGIAEIPPETAAATQPSSETLSGDLSRKKINDPGEARSVQPILNENTVDTVSKKKSY